MIAPYDKCNVKFSINSKAKGCNIYWVADILKHTLVDEIICIEDVCVTEGGMSKDMTRAIIDFCMGNPESIIVLMCGEVKRTKFGENGKAIKPSKGTQLRERENLARLKAVYEVIGFQDISPWIDYAGTGVFLYGNDKSIDFIDRLGAFQAGSYLSTIVDNGAGLAVIANELKSSPKARTILEDILKECDSHSTVDKLNAFGRKPNK